MGSWKSYLGEEVLIYEDDAGALHELCVPLMSVNRSIINKHRVIGQAWQSKYHDTIKKTQYKLSMKYVPEDGEEKDIWMTKWFSTIKQIPGGYPNVWLPSWKKDYSVVSATTTEITIKRSFSEENDSSITRHLAIFPSGNLSVLPDYRKVTSFTKVSDTQDLITINSSLSGMGASTIIMNLFYVSFLSDTFPMSYLASNKIKLEMSFIENQRGTP